MNDATELESSLAGAIDFFQSLRRKLGTLEGDAGMRNDKLQAVTHTVVALEQNQQQVQQSLATLASDLRTQSATLRQELSALDQRIASADRIGTLETQFERHHAQLEQLEQMARAGQEQLGQFAARVATQSQRLIELEQALETRDQAVQAVQAVLPALADLRAELQHHTQTLDALNQSVASGESTRLEFQEAQQSRLGALAESVAAVRQDLQTQQERLKHLDILMGKVSADTNSTRQILNVLQTDLTTQSDTLRELDQSWGESLVVYQSRLSQLEAAMTGTGFHAQSLADGATASDRGADLDSHPLREALATQVQALAELRQATQRQFADLATQLENQHLELHNASEWLGNLHQQIQQLHQERSALEPAGEPPLSPIAINAPDTRQLRQDLDTLQEMVTALATRLIGQGQTFGESFEQLRSLNADIRGLEQKFARLESLPQQLSTLEQGLAGHRQELVLLNEAVRHVQAESQQVDEALRQGGHDSRIAELETRLSQQSERLSGLTATVEAIRTDMLTTQEKVVALATNVVKRVQECQNQVMTTDTNQGERLQKIEQKIIGLQATLETLEMQRKTRRWFSMPPTVSTIVLAVGTAALAILAQVIWTIS
jgi:chromosome segregation ATPase